MIDLNAKYGSNIFNRKESYKFAGYMGYVIRLGASLFIALLIVEIFGIEWDYATLKVFVIVLVFDLLREVIKWPFTRLHYKFFIRPTIAKEMRHYLNVFMSQEALLIPQTLATYDDFLLFSSYSPNLSPDMRVLSAIYYGTIVSLYSVDSNMESRYYKVWCDVITDFMERHPNKILHS